MQDDMPEIDANIGSSRANFEQYIVATYGADDRFERLDDGYMCDEIDGMWCAWKASAESFVVELPAFPTQRICFNYGNCYIDYLNKSDVIKSIENAGGRVK